MGPVNITWLNRIFQVEGTTEDGLRNASGEKKAEKAISNRTEIRPCIFLSNMTAFGIKFYSYIGSDNVLFVTEGDDTRNESLKDRWECKERKGKKDNNPKKKKRVKPSESSYNVFMNHLFDSRRHRRGEKVTFYFTPRPPFFHPLTSSCLATFSIVVYWSGKIEIVTKFISALRFETVVNLLESATLGFLTFGASRWQTELKTMADTLIWLLGSGRG